jgi:Sec-independent protein translocase protein TatA
VFLLFGTRRLGELGKGIGDGIRGFKLGIAGEPEERDASKAEQPDPLRQLVGRVPSAKELGDATSCLPPATVGLAQGEAEHASGKVETQNA